MVSIDLKYSVNYLMSKGSNFFNKKTDWLQSEIFWISAVQD